MRNKYTKEFDIFIRENVSRYTLEELRQVLSDEFKIELSSEAIRRYLNRHKVKGKYKDYQENKARNGGGHSSPLGSEQITKDGVFIKVAQPDKWRRKSRVMYEKYHNCKLRDDEYIVFLNWDNNDFCKENLVKTNQREIAYLHNYGTFSSNPKLTELGLLSAKLMIKAKSKG